jgi:hypothetical protein
MKELLQNTLCVSPPDLSVVTKEAHVRDFSGLNEEAQQQWVCTNAMHNQGRRHYESLNKVIDFIAVPWQSAHQGHEQPQNKKKRNAFIQ